MSQQVIAAAVISIFVGGVIGLLQKYVPKFNDWFLALEEVQRNLVYLVLAVLWGVIMFGAACFQFVLPGNEITCDQTGLLAAATAVIAYLVANVSVMNGTPTLRSTERAVSRRVTSRNNALRAAATPPTMTGEL